MHEDSLPWCQMSHSGMTPHVAMNFVSQCQLDELVHMPCIEVEDSLAAVGRCELDANAA